MSTKTNQGTLQVAGVTLTHPDRVLWEEQGITKQGLAEFYVEIADWILPHVANRPLALVRVQVVEDRPRHQEVRRPRAVLTRAPSRCPIGLTARRCSKTIPRTCVGELS